MINITLKDGTIMQVENGATCLDVASRFLPRSGTRQHWQQR